MLLCLSTHRDGFHGLARGGRANLKQTCHGMACGRRQAKSHHLKLFLSSPPLALRTARPIFTCLTEQHDRVSGEETGCNHQGC
jgi:hypothetical protein